MAMARARARATVPTTPRATTSPRAGNERCRFLGARRSVQWGPRDVGPGGNPDRVVIRSDPLWPTPIRWSRTSDGPEWTGTPGRRVAPGLRRGLQGRVASDRAGRAVHRLRNRGPRRSEG